MYVAGSRVTNVFGSIAKDITIDFSYINVLFGTGGGFKGAENITSPTFKFQNMVVENQDLGTVTSPLFSSMVDFTNCRFENLVGNFPYGMYEYIVLSNIKNCIFKNIVNNNSSKLILRFTGGTFTVDNCMLDIS